MAPTLVQPSKAKSTASSVVLRAEPALIPSPTTGVRIGALLRPRMKPTMVMRNSGISLQMVETIWNLLAEPEPSVFRATTPAMMPSATGMAMLTPSRPESSVPTFTPYPARYAG